jgi:hypothetical protein
MQSLEKRARRMCVLLTNMIQKKIFHSLFFLYLIQCTIIAIHHIFFFLLILIMRLCSRKFFSFFSSYLLLCTFLSYVVQLRSQPSTLSTYNMIDMTKTSLIGYFRQWWDSFVHVIFFCHTIVIIIFMGFNAPTYMK